MVESNTGGAAAPALLVPELSREPAEDSTTTKCSRVAELRQLYQDGNYVVDAEKVSARIIDDCMKA